MKLNVLEIKLQQRRILRSELGQENSVHFFMSQILIIILLSLIKALDCSQTVNYIIKMAVQATKVNTFTSSMNLTQLSMSIWSDLAPIRQLTAPVIQFFVAQVAAQITHRAKTKGQLSAQSISRELENEGINWSNKKILRVADALKTLIIAYLAAFRAENSEESKSSLREQITSRSSIQKEDVVEALSAAIDTEASEAFSFDTVTSLMRLQKLADFQVVLRHEISTPDCKNINQTRAVLIFKIARPNGSVLEKRIDVSLDELRQFKTELTRIEETLN